MNKLMRYTTATTLLATLKRGPVFTDYVPPFDGEEASRQYRLWFQSWVINDLKNLIPELNEVNDISNP